METTTSILLDTFETSSLSLKNRIVMAPMTRCRATADHIPTTIMEEYYAQRASAGLIITEGTAPSLNGVGYARIPGIYNNEQVEAWKKVTEKVHSKEGKIFIQIMHTGRVSHLKNMPANSTIMAPSAIAPSNTKSYVDGEGELEIPTPQEMTISDIENAVQEYVLASKNAIIAGFDGVELHGANGYLIEQFINPGANHRKDTYGGSVENRSRFALEVAKQVAKAIGKEKVGIRLSPGGAFNDLFPFVGQDETFIYLAEELGKIGLVYMHLVDHSSMGTPMVSKALTETMKKEFGGTIILSGGYDKVRAEQDLTNGIGHLVAFGRPFLANPDLPNKMFEGTKLNEPDFSTFYTPGEKGYTDYN